jgi:hypothetical protein
MFTQVWGQRHMRRLSKSTSGTCLCLGLLRVAKRPCSRSDQSAHFTASPSDVLWAECKSLILTQHKPCIAVVSVKSCCDLCSSFFISLFPQLARLIVPATSCSRVSSLVSLRASATLCRGSRLSAQGSSLVSLTSDELHCACCAMTDVVQLLNKHERQSGRGRSASSHQRLRRRMPIGLFGDHPCCFFASASCLFSALILLFLEVMIFI